MVLVQEQSEGEPGQHLRWPQAKEMPSPAELVASHYDDEVRCSVNAVEAQVTKFILNQQLLYIHLSQSGNGTGCWFLRRLNKSVK